ncbi:NAD-dependent epimerase/dehydratase family protein [Oscillochloris sp. ZM17-4]|uniref:NAD-dependent epimerase/dehydratase family protein n=1 Tax=Oscillochloris sp. ZM17-4 TaxID=2866714 RepID=UPI001C737175|nr:NAD-dependent epimerase/dehydratase family protein [Oscillochloris sp. ZM17-4]MBX0331489.1 NAD-dependent epimerase/dehydratase family protein [Oscillochloris sp. ZM17-4]
MHIAITGGGGELGRELAPYLTSQGHSVVSIDRALPAGLGPWGGTIRHVVADVRDFGQLVGAMSGCDALVHLAAHRAPGTHPDTVVYADNTLASYNALSAAAALGIGRVCLASSVNAIGGAFSRAPRYDYFPVDERHPTYAEDPYSLSKWVLEQQADAFARRYEALTIASLRFHWLLPSRERAAEITASSVWASRHLWAYTLLSEAARACLLALTASFAGHEVFYIAARDTAAAEPSAALAQRHYPDTPVRGELPGHESFFDTSKAERVLGWVHV